MGAALSCGGAPSPAAPVAPEPAKEVVIAAPPPGDAAAICAMLAAEGLVTGCFDKGYYDNDEGIDVSGMGFALPGVPRAEAGGVFVFGSEEECRREVADKREQKPDFIPFMLVKCEARLVVMVVGPTWEARDRIAAALEIEVVESPCPPTHRPRDGRCVEAKVTQCNRLVGVINEQQKRLKSLTGNTPDELERLAVVLDGVAGAVEAVELDDPDLEALRDPYAAMSRELAAVSRETRVALESNDPNRADGAAKKMHSFTPREHDLIDAINAYCSH